MFVVDESYIYFKGEACIRAECTAIFDGALQQFSQLCIELFQVSLPLIILAWR